MEKHLKQVIEEMMAYATSYTYAAPAEMMAIYRIGRQGLNQHEEASRLAKIETHPEAELN